MATDNRHRPGPGFRCPDCWSTLIRVVSATPKKVGRRHKYETECRACKRRWWSGHKAARREALELEQ